MSDLRTALARLLDVVDRCEPNHPNAVGDAEYDAARVAARQALKSADGTLSDRDRLRALLHEACDAISGEPGAAMDRCRQHLGDALALLALGDAPALPLAAE